MNESSCGLRTAILEPIHFDNTTQLTCRSGNRALNSHPTAGSAAARDEALGALVRSLQRLALAHGLLARCGRYCSGLNSLVAQGVDEGGLQPDPYASVGGTHGIDGPAHSALFVPADEVLLALEGGRAALEGALHAARFSILEEELGVGPLEAQVVPNAASRAIAAVRDGVVGYLGERCAGKGFHSGVLSQTGVVNGANGAIIHVCVESFLSLWEFVVNHRRLLACTYVGNGNKEEESTHNNQGGPLEDIKDVGRLALVGITAAAAALLFGRK
mmetsp:Transcript_5028/g.14277  ORF Transcript_5028/g.14277 Transcript_5028/m.14277 type:complete len:273 (-) Transcript_5028:568-1386(-)